VFKGLMLYEYNIWLIHTNISEKRDASSPKVSIFQRNSCLCL